MKRAYFFLPLAGLVVLSGYLGLQVGQVPGETEIINRYAATYLPPPRRGKPHRLRAPPRILIRQSAW